MKAIHQTLLRCCLVGLAICFPAHASPALEETKVELLQRMEAIVLPEVSFGNATLRDAATMLQKLAREYDQQGRGITIRLGLDKETERSLPTLTFRARQISLLEVIKLLTHLTEVPYRIHDGGLLLTRHQEEKLMTKLYHMMPGLLVPTSAFGYGKRKGDFGADLQTRADGTPSSGFKGFLAEMGVGWPEGSDIRYLPSLGVIAVRNTVENMALFERVLAERNSVSFQIESEFQFVQFDMSDIEDLVRKGDDDVEHLQKLWGAGKGTLLTAPKVLSQAGTEAAVESVIHYSYPTEVRHDRALSTTNGTQLASDSVSFVTPTGLETQEAGVSICSLPEVSPEGQMIVLTIGLKLSGSPAWTTNTLYYAETDKGLRLAEIEQPLLPALHLSTTLAIYPGEKLLVGGGIPDTAAGTVLYVFVTAHLIDPRGKAVSPYGAEAFISEVVE